MQQELFSNMAAVKKVRPASVQALCTDMFDATLLHRVQNPASCKDGLQHAAFGVVVPVEVCLAILSPVQQEHKCMQTVSYDANIQCLK